MRTGSPRPRYGATDPELETLIRMFAREINYAESTSSLRSALGYLAISAGYAAAAEMTAFQQKKGQEEAEALQFRLADAIGAIAKKWE